MPETLEQLVAERRGYKYLSKDGTSPYQSYKYSLKSKKNLITALDTNSDKQCAKGWNLATLKWIANNCLKLDGVIAEFTIPPEAQIIVPTNLDGKFRTNIVKLKKIHRIDVLLPHLKDLQRRLNNYKPVNPFQAEEMPDPDKIKSIVRSIGTQVGAQVRDQVGTKVGAQVWDQVGAQVWAQVGDQVGTQVRTQVRDQVWDQVGMIAYYAVKLFMQLDYEHPAFDLIRMGVMVIKVKNKLKVFGKNGKYLGGIDVV